MMKLNRRTFIAQAALGVFAGVARLFAHAEPVRRAPGLSPEPWTTSGQDALSRWRAAKRYPVVAGDAAELRILAEAVRCGRRVRFCYLGGSEVGARREISPGMLYTVDGFDGVYFSGYCHERRAERTFMVSRMQAIEVSAT